MTVPDPTAPTAEVVIARVVLPEVGHQCVCTMFGGKDHNVNPPCGTVRASHDLAAAVVAAIRAMSPETLAELRPDLDVERTLKPEWVDTGEPAPTAAAGLVGCDPQPPQTRREMHFVRVARVVGPWQETP